MEAMRMAVSGAAQAVHRVEQAVQAMPASVRLMAGRELAALSAALVAITRAQSVIASEIAAMRGAGNGQ